MVLILAVTIPRVASFEYSQLRPAKRSGISLDLILRFSKIRPIREGIVSKEKRRKIKNENANCKISQMGF